jgi:hypothetical protein
MLGKGCNQATGRWGRCAARAAILKIQDMRRLFGDAETDADLGERVPPDAELEDSFAEFGGLFSALC